MRDWREDEAANQTRFRDINESIVIVQKTAAAAVKIARQSDPRALR